jgi:hypothetical protein
VVTWACVAFLLDRGDSQCQLKVTGGPFGDIFLEYAKDLRIIVLRRV